jgi:nucleotide-binding universal stress UspA family protein
MPLADRIHRQPSVGLIQVKLSVPYPGEYYLENIGRARRRSPRTAVLFKGATMFKHILIPTDGSELAAKAIAAGIEFAKETGARITAYCAPQELHLRNTVRGDYDRQIKTQFEQHSRESAEEHVAQIAAAAKAAGVRCDTLVSKADPPYEGIVEAARTRKCDAIFMASHGRSGIARLFLGSVTHKVLTHSKIPVFVYR